MKPTRYSPVHSLAFLKARWDDKARKDYLDTFLPFVAECVRTSDHDIVSLHEVSNRFRELFGLADIPGNTLKTLLKRLVRQDYLTVSDNGTYVRNLEKLSTINFQPLQEQILTQHDSLVSALISFVKEQFEKQWDTNEAETALEQFVAENREEIVKSIVLNKKSFSSEIDRGHKYIVGRFLQELYDKKDPKLTYFKNVAMGMMLASAIYYPEPSTAETRRFRDTDVFLDTKIIVFALGHAGPVLQAPAMELIQLLYASGINIKCFTHTQKEIIGILEACAYRIGQHKLADAYGPSIEYFVSESVSASDIELYISRLPIDLEGLRITVEAPPPYDETLAVIDENSLLNELGGKINYNPKSPKPLQRDVASIASIVRLRKGESMQYLERCGAIFVTPNRALARVSHEFLNQDGFLSNVPPCVTDDYITNLLWLKKPTSKPDLPFKRIIADAFAATQPSTRLWQTYLTELEKLQAHGRISEEDYYVLRFDLTAKRHLMDRTLGDANAFFEADVYQILKYVRDKIKSDADLEYDRERLQYKGEIEKLEDDRISLQQEVESLRRKELMEKLNLQFRAQKYAKNLIWFVNLFAFVILLASVLSTFPWDFPSLNSAKLLYSFVAGQLILAVLTVLNLLKGTNIASVLRPLELKLSEQIYALLKQLVIDKT